MHLLGDANWWLPGWKDRLLPHLAIDPPEGAHQPAEAHRRASVMTASEPPHDHARTTT
jgi:RND superfamily putative drug exporter